MKGRKLPQIASRSWKRGNLQGGFTSEVASRGLSEVNLATDAALGRKTVS